MTLNVKRFDELTPDELYEIVKLRVEVFVVEQECAYMEFDDRDQNAVHVWLSDDEGICAYLRVLDRGVECEHVAIGRVITRMRGRGTGLGARIMTEGKKIAREVFGADHIYLEAQTYAEGFYAKQGFRRISDEFMMDGIPHYKMLAEPGA